MDWHSRTHSLSGIIFIACAFLIFNMRSAAGQGCNEDVAWAINGGEEIRSVSSLEGGRVLLAASNSGAYLIDLYADRLLCSISLPERSIAEMSASRDGSTIFSIGFGILRRYSYPTLEITGEWADSAECNQVVVSNDGKWVALANFHHEVWVFNPETMDVPVHLVSVNFVNGLKFSHVGNTLIVISRSGNTTVWRLSSMPELLWESPAKSSLNYGSRLNDSSLFYTGYGWSLFSVDVDAADSLVPVVDHPGGIEWGADMDLSPDGSKIGMITERGEFYVWDIESERGDRVINPVFSSIRRFAWSADGEHVIAWPEASHYSGFHLYDLKSREVRSPLDQIGFLYGMDCSDSVLVVAHHRYVDIRRFTSEGNTLVKRHELRIADYCGIVRVSPDSKWIVGVCKGVVRRWDVKGDIADTVQLPSNMWAHFVAWHPDAAEFVTCTQSSLYICDIEGGCRRSHFQSDSGLRGVSFSPDGSTLYGGNDTTIFKWDVASGRLIDSIPTPFSDGSILRHIVLSPDGSMLGALYSNSVSVVWKLDGLRLFRMRESDGLGLNSIDFSSDGLSVLRSGSEIGNGVNSIGRFAGVVEVWSLADDDIVYKYRTIGGAGGAVRSLKSSESFIHSSRETVALYFPRWTVGVSEDETGEVSSGITTVRCTSVPCSREIPLPFAVTPGSRDLASTLFDVSGRIVAREVMVMAGPHTGLLSLPSIPPGWYMLVANVADQTAHVRVLVD